MLITVFGTIMVLMLAGAAVDLGLYYTEVQRANSIAAVAEDMAYKVMAANVMDEGYGPRLMQQVTQFAENNGLDTNRLNLEISRKILPGSNDRYAKNVEFTFIFDYTDSYDCIFLPWIGVNQLPVSAWKNEGIIFSDVYLWEPGDPYVTWQPNKPNN